MLVHFSMSAMGMSKRGEMTPTLLMRPFRVTTIFPLLWSSMISKSPMYSAERAGRCEREKVARVLRRGCGVQCEPESSGQQTIKCPQVSTGRERWWCVHSVTAASHGRRTSQSGASVPALASRRSPLQRTLLHHLQELDDNLAAGADQNLALAALLGCDGKEGCKRREI